MGDYCYHPKPKKVETILISTEVRRCVKCGKKYIVLNPRQKFCCSRCRMKAKREREKLREKEDEKR